MKHPFNFLILVFALFILSCDENKAKTNTGNKSSIDDYSAKMDSLFSTATPRNFNGVVLISQNGKVKYLKEYGFSDFEKQTPISIKDNFRIQSNSKQITAVLILKEFEKGNIELHAPIKKYLPELKPTWADSVTIHQLLNMSSGVVALDKALLFEPGTNYKYSNAAYGLLGDIIERVSGNTYIDQANNLFEDLSMGNTYCYEFGADQKGLINGYVNTKDAYDLVDFYSRGITSEGWLDFIPAGGIISNANDLIIWDTQLHNRDILKAESYELMTNFDVRGQHAAFGEEKIGYGYGLRIDDSKKFKIIGHAGKGIGFTNIKFYIPEKKVHVVMLENVYNEDPNIVYHFEKEILNLVLDAIY